MNAPTEISPPDPGPLPTVTLGTVADERLPGGVRAVVVRQSQVPLVQLRLRVPLGDVRARDGASIRLLPKMLLAGTGARSGSEMASAIQRLGASIDAAATHDHLAVTASAPAAHLAAVLELIADVLANPALRSAEIAGERERVAQEILQEAVDPTGVAGRALAAELYPGHPYADALPSLASVQRTGAGTLRRFHADRVRSSGSTLVVVGDVDPAHAVMVAGAALAGWSAEHGTPTVVELGAPRDPGANAGVLVVDRPGAVQSNLRIGARCFGRQDPDFPALVLAMTVLGGGFSSRLVSNLRERNGFTYSPGAVIAEHRLAAAVAVRAEVATEVTAEALAEVRYELARIATGGVTEGELETSRRYVLGALAMASATQAGLADLLASLVAHDLDPTYLEQFVRDLERLDASDVSAVAARALGPIGMTTVVAGDAALVADTLAPLDCVNVVAH